jgi:hypothetical protein
MVAILTPFSSRCTVSSWPNSTPLGRFSFSAATSWPPNAVRPCPADVLVQLTGRRIDSRNMTPRPKRTKRRQRQIRTIIPLFMRGLREARFRNSGPAVTAHRATSNRVRTPPFRWPQWRTLALLRSLLMTLQFGSSACGGRAELIPSLLEGFYASPRSKTNFRSPPVSIADLTAPRAEINDPFPRIFEPSDQIWGHLDV